MVDFSKLKALSGKGSIEQLSDALGKMAAGGTEKRGADERFWQPTVDKAGNGYAVIRFLPAPGEEDMPFIRLWEHGFQGPTGKWYIEKSRTTLGEKDPVSEYNNKLWNSGLESDKEIARKQKRNLRYISNIYVVEDSGNPENNGKVFLFKYGKKIFDKLNEAMNPQFADEEAVNPFDFWTGANFKLKIRKVDGYRNYDKSEFTATGPLAGDKELEKIWLKEHSLKEFIDPTSFESYADLEKKLQETLAVSSSIDPAAARKAPVVRPTADSVPWDNDEETAAAPKLKAASAPKSFDDDEEIDYDFFDKIANA